MLWMAQYRVEEFHKGAKQTIGHFPQIRDAALRRRLIEEESQELCEALFANDIVGVADGIADLLYVTLGTAVSCGIRAEDVFREVHTSNMAKAPFEKDNTGKIIKPEGWKKPDILKCLLEQGYILPMREDDIE